MEKTKLKKTQLLTLSIITTLLFITPLLSSSQRSTYLYFIINVLIIALGIEAGLLSPNVKPELDTKRSSNQTVITPNPSLISTSKGLRVDKYDQINEESGVNARMEVFEESNGGTRTAKMVEKLTSEKIIGVVTVEYKEMKKCPSMPSIFFIGSDEKEVVEVEEKRVEYEEEIINYGEEEQEGEEEEEKELFVKAEIFIGNFYRQLKMQREESWNKIHGVY